MRTVTLELPAAVADALSWCPEFRAIEGVWGISGQWLYDQKTGESWYRMRNLDPAVARRIIEVGNDLVSTRLDVAVRETGRRTPRPNDRGCADSRNAT